MQSKVAIKRLSSRTVQTVWRFRRWRKPDVNGWRMLCLVFVFGCSIPFWAKGYILFQASSVCIYALALTGLNVLTGYSGQLSVGHGAFYGIGGFGVAILVSRWGVPYYFALPAVAVFSLLLGVLFGIPALRLERISLALATFSLAIALPQLFERFDDWTGGSTGLDVSKPGIPRFLAEAGVNGDQWIYIVSYLILGLTIFLLTNILQSRFGRAVRAIRDNDISSSAMGINNNLYKIACFGVSAMLTGTAGGLATLLAGHVAPETFDVGLSISFLTGTVVGGLGSTLGPVYGAIFIQYLPNFTDGISKALTSAIYGGILIFFIYTDPRGISGMVATFRVRFNNWWSYFRI